MKNRRSISRRTFLKSAAAAGAVASSTLWLPRHTRASSPAGPIRRIIIINAPGGVRWATHWDGAGDVVHNPWGIVNNPTSRTWTSPAVTGAAGAAKAPAFGLSRMLVQKPQWTKDTDWPSMYAYLSSDAAADYNLSRPQMSAAWTPAGKPTVIPNALDMAASTSVVRLTANPGGTFNSDHLSATHQLVTGLPAGQVGVVTAMQHALETALGSAFASTYAMPAVSMGPAGWALGAGDFAKSRPIYLGGALPDTDPGNSVARWGSPLEGDWDQDLLASMQQYAGQSIADYVNDKVNGDAHVKQLVLPSLHLGANPTATFGTLIDGHTPVTNAMLWEVFGLGSAATVAGDPYWDVYASDQSTLTPSWAAGSSFGTGAATAVRFLQMGSPVVSLGLNVTYDSHSGEVQNFTTFRTQAGCAVAVQRTLAGLAFALQRIGDPLAPTKSLWDSTVVFVCSEFGRGSGSPNGFASPTGADGGGSGHGEWSAWPVLGGPVLGGGTIIKDPTADPTTNPAGFFSQSRLYTTLLAGMGVSGSNSTYFDYSQLPPIAGSLISGV
jgi:hypothetical protein